MKLEFSKAFKDKLRGTAFPESASSGNWSTITKIAKAKHPFRYWIVDTVVENWLEGSLVNLYKDFIRLIRNGFIDRVHVMKSPEIKFGEYRNFDYKVLYCTFNELVDYVEISLSTMEEFNDKIKWYEDWPFYFKFNRNRENGLKHLEWETSLKKMDGTMSEQAVTAQKVKDLYLWWTEERPKRVETTEAYEEYCRVRSLHQKNDDDFFGIVPGYSRERITEILDELNELEESQHEEDTEKLIKLIKIRRSIWT